MFLNIITSEGCPLRTKLWTAILPASNYAAHLPTMANVMHAALLTRFNSSCISVFVWLAVYKKWITLRTSQEAYLHTDSSIFTGCVFVHPLTIWLAICTACVETHSDNIHWVWLHFIHITRVTNFTILTFRTALVSSRIKLTPIWRMITLSCNSRLFSMRRFILKFYFFLCWGDSSFSSHQPDPACFTYLTGNFRTLLNLQVPGFQCGRLWHFLLLLC